MFYGSNGDHVAYFMNCYQNTSTFPTICDLVLMTQSDPGEEGTFSRKELCHADAIGLKAHINSTHILTLPL